MYISLYVDVNTFIGGRQPQNKLMRLRTFKKKGLVFGEPRRHSGMVTMPRILKAKQTDDQPNRQRNEQVNPRDQS